MNLNGVFYEAPRCSAPDFFRLGVLLSVLAVCALLIPQNVFLFGVAAFFFALIPAFQSVLIYFVSRAKTGRLSSATYLLAGAIAYVLIATFTLVFVITATSVQKDGLTPLFLLLFVGLGWSSFSFTRKAREETFIVVLLPACGGWILFSWPPNNAAENTLVVGILLLLVSVVCLGLSRHWFSERKEGAASLGKAKLALLICLMASAVSASIPAIVRTAMKDPSRPAFANFRPASASNGVVLTAKFTGDMPSDPYWRSTQTYARFLGNGHWEELPGDPYGPPLSDTVEPMDPEKSVYAYTRTWKSEHTFEGAGLDRVYLDGGTSSYSTRSIREDSKKWPYLWESRDESFKHARRTSFIEILTSTYPAEAQKDFFDRFRQIDGFSKRGDALIPPAEMARTYALVKKWQSEGLQGRALLARIQQEFESKLAYHFDHQYEDAQRNGLDYFLFEDQKGVCRHFASAFALMARMGGMPTRVVSGFAGGVKNPELKTWSVRARDAHAWTEVWFPDSGWERIDPTAWVRVEKPVPAESFQERLRGVLEGVVGQVATFGEGFKTAGVPQDFGASADSAGSETNWRPMAVRALPWLAGSIVLALVVLAGVGSKKAWLALRAHLTLPAEERAWRRLRKRLIRMGYEVSAAEGPSRLKARIGQGLGGPLLVRWTAALDGYERWKFGEEQVPDLVVALDSLGRPLRLLVRRSRRRSR